MPGLKLVRIYMYYSNTFDLISLSPAAKVCLLLQFCRAKPKRSSVYFTSKQILPFGFSGQNCDPCRPTLNSLDLFHDTMCVQAHLCVYYSGGQMLAALAQNFTIIRTTASFQANVFCNVKL